MCWGSAAHMVMSSARSWTGSARSPS
jgi:hypothetical protein